MAMGRCGLASLALVALITAACAAPAADHSGRPPADSRATTASIAQPATGASAPAVSRQSPKRTLPPVAGRVDYQLGGAYPPARGVRIVTRDRTDRADRSRYSICYLNAFQTQPDAKAFWTHKHPDLLLRRHGTLVSDPGWPGEYLLDTSTARKRQRIAAVLGGWIDGCAKNGYRAVEPDNLDSWLRSHTLLSATDNLRLIELLAQRAHARGLSIAQKNAAELGRSGKTAGLDFAVAEECQVYAECGAYTAVYGAHVIEIEYTDQPRRFFRAACRARGTKVSVLWRDRDVVPRGQRGYHSEYC